MVDLTGYGLEGFKHFPAEWKFAERKPRHVATRMGETGYEPAGDGVVDQHEHDGDGVGRSIQRLERHGCISQDHTGFETDQFGNK